MLLTDKQAGSLRAMYFRGGRTASLLPGFLLLGLSVSLKTVAAQYPQLSSDQFPVPVDLSGLHFYLITVDVGDSVWDNFGHTALRVIDENANTDLVYNWGVFDLNSNAAAFAFNFFKGVMDYRLAVSPPALEFDLYRSQQRTVWQDRINLTNPQKEVLFRRLAWNAEVANRDYAYDYHFDNCTTRVRDYLNEALAGSLAIRYSDQAAGTFRDRIQDHYSSNALIAFSLFVLMNGNIDRPVTEWESMYLPISLRNRLAMLQSDVSENGKRLPLLSDQQIIAEFAPPRVETNPYRVASVALLLPGLTLLLMLKRNNRIRVATRSRIGLKQEGFSFRLMGSLGLVTSFFSGIYGTLMLLSWFSSAHIDTHHNVNLLLFWPTDLLGIVVALRWLFFCKPWPMTHNSAPFIHYYFMTHLLGMLLYAGVAMTGLVDQELGLILTSVVPGFLLFMLLAWIFGFQPAKSRTMIL